MANSPTSKQAVIASLNGGKATAGCNQLAALANEAQAEAGKQLTSAQSQAVVDATVLISAIAGCR